MSEGNIYPNTWHETVTRRHRPARILSRSGRRPDTGD